MLTEEDIKEINSNCPSSEQGIYKEPYGIPDKIKGHVIYMRWETGGVSGGSCWESSNPRPYTNSEPKPKFKVLDLVLKKLRPQLTFLEFREIEELIVSNQETEYYYYGNSTDYGIEFIELSALYEALEKL